MPAAGHNAGAAARPVTCAVSLGLRFSHFLAARCPPTHPRLPWLISTAVAQNSGTVARVLVRPCVPMQTAVTVSVVVR